MIKMFLQLFRLLTNKQRREFYILQCLMFASAVAELVGIASILPFIALAANPDVLNTDPMLGRAHRLLGAPDYADFLIYVGIAFVAFMVVANLVMMVSQFLMNRYSFRVGGEISVRLYGYYLSKDVIFHARHNSSLLIQRVMRDSMILSASLIAPALRLNARLFSILLLSMMIVYVDPFVALCTVAVLVLVYWCVFHYVRRRLNRNGLLVSTLGQKRNQLLNESFGGIRDVKLYSAEHRYWGQYRSHTKTSDRASADNLILGESPYFIVEMVVFAGMVALTLYLFRREGGLGEMLPFLTLYALAGVKLIPKVQQCYQALAKIRSAQPVFDRVFPDLVLSNEKNPFSDEGQDIFRPSATIALEGVDFRFADDGPYIFRDFSLTIEPGKVTAITGESGVGKSTLLEILMGLLEPQSGSICLDGTPLVAEQLNDWKASIGYVPQDVYLVDASLARNIAFGAIEEDIDMPRVAAAASLACLDSVVAELPEQYASHIGERGAKLSGGQKQRIGIARALYRNVSVLLLDEATSALDADTQSAVLRNLRTAASGLTVIMITHREETLALADVIIKLNRGASGVDCEVQRR